MLNKELRWERNADGIRCFPAYNKKDCRVIDESERSKYLALIKAKENEINCLYEKIA